MKKAILFSLALLLAIGTVVWLCRSTVSSAPVASGAFAAPTKRLDSVKAHAGLSKKRSTQVAQAEKEKQQRLLVYVKSLLVQTRALSSGDIAQFQKLAELNNEFCSHLDTGAAAFLVKNMPVGFVTTGLGDQTLRFWAERDRLAAAEWMAAYPDASPIVSSAVVHGWFVQDPEGLRAYMDGLPEGGWKTNVTTSASEDALVAGNPEAAIDFLNSAPGNNPRREELYEWAATKWGVSDYETAKAWAQQAANLGQRDRLLAAVNIGYANIDPVAAANGLLNSVSNTEILGPAVGSIVRIWSAKEPQNAAQWVQDFPSGPIKDNAIGQLLAVWAQSHWDDAVRWQTSLTDADARHYAMKVMNGIRAEIEEPGTGELP